MSLLELVVALTVFAIIMMGLAATLASGLTLTRNNRNRSVAANLASQEMDTVRAADFTTLASRTTTEAVGGVGYTVHRELTWVNHAATNGPCDATNTTPEVLRVHVWVDWPGRQGVPPATADTVLTPPVGAYSTNSGHIAVDVLDNSSAPEDNVMVSVTGPQASSAPTNSDGCAFFAFLPAGTYTVSLNTPGWVDRQGNASPSQSVGVNVGQVSSVEFDYDQAATLQLTFGDGNEVVPSNLPVTLGNTILLPTGTKLVAGSANPLSVGNLFPASDGYQAWAGSCADADPQGVDAGSNAFYPGAQRDDPINAPPNQTTSATVTVASVTVQVVDGSGNPQANRSITAVHAADSVCASGETHTVGTTDANGDITIGLPFGTWQLQESGHSAVGSWPSVTLNPLDTLPRATVTVAGS
jgi:Tfp pilus assembly protein PilV